jgi:hypothetical protein
MKRLIILKSVLVISFASTQCKPNASETSQVNSKLSENVEISCRDSVEENGMKVDSTADIMISGEKISIKKQFSTLIENAGYHRGSEVIETTINSVFDFNRVSKERVYVVTNPSKNKITTQDKVYEKNIGLLMVSYDLEKLVVREDETQKEIISMTDCTIN